MQMKSLIRILPALAAALAFWGCSGPTMTINGVTYQILSPKEEQLLVVQTRLLLNQPNNALNREDIALIQNTTPAIEINYTGDRAGKARLIWEAKDKRIITLFDGPFFTEEMGWLLETEKRLPDVQKILPPSHPLYVPEPK